MVKGRAPSVRRASLGASGLGLAGPLTWFELGEVEEVMMSS